MEEMNTDAVAREEGTGLVGRFIGVITAPRKTFDDIAAAPTWLVPLLLVTIAAGVITYFLTDLIIDQQVAAMSENPNMTQEQIDAAVGFMANFVWITPVLTTPIAYLVIAGVLMFTGNVLMGKDGTFKQIFSVTAWSGIITLVTSLVSVPLMLSSGEMVSQTSLAFLAGDDKESFLYSILSGVDLLTLWWVAVIGIGIAAVYKMESQKGITVTMVWYAIVLFGGAALKAAFS